MTIYERIQKLAKEHSISIRALEEKLEFGNGTLKRWDTNVPAVDRVEKVANFFDVSVDYLLGRTEKQNTITEKDLDRMLDNAVSFSGQPMNEHDREVIRAYLTGKFGR